MEENKPGIMKYAMTYGAIIGLALVVYIVLLYMMDATFNRFLGLIQYAVLIVGIYLATKSYRDKESGGFITYGKALKTGILVSFFVGIITVFFNFILMRFIDPELVDKYMLIMEEQFENSRFIPENQIDAALERTRNGLTAAWSIPVGVLTFTLIGFIISLITSAFLKKDPAPFS
ncbi:MAG TPA: DUF4199 domain-containing protein [Bacteroidales bacterium]|nr:DUF4199 domain-containing protein [Bacteroidales bacterium]